MEPAGRRKSVDPVTSGSGAATSESSVAHDGRKRQFMGSKAGDLSCRLRPPQPVDYFGSGVAVEFLLDRVDGHRLAASGELDDATRMRLGQFMTPPSVARLMASMFRTKRSDIRLLDAGAGVGSLTAAFVSELCGRRTRPRSISATAYEVDRRLVRYLEESGSICKLACRTRGVEFSLRIEAVDFLRAASGMIGGPPLDTPSAERFTCAILNPPYAKIRSDSTARTLLRGIGVEAGNLYTAFVAVAIDLLEAGGELVAITPRSFCNGPYFRPFRRLLLERMALKRIHVFETRNRAFRDDDVLQENVIFHAIKGATRTGVVVSTSASPDNPKSSQRVVSYDKVVMPEDPEAFIRIAASASDDDVASMMESLPSTIGGLGIDVSTGRVVDFRAREHLRKHPSKHTVPLIYPCHMEAGEVVWPKVGGRKPNALAANDRTRDLLVPRGTYVLVRRFSAKEERRRIVAAVCDGSSFDADALGFENHLNYYHRGGRGLPMVLARGLAAFLNSTPVDRFLRQFNGHTQVNATDLRRLPYPTRKNVEALGARVMEHSSDDQEALDRVVARMVFQSSSAAGKASAR